MMNAESFHSKQNGRHWCLNRKSSEKFHMLARKLLFSRAEKEYEPQIRMCRKAENCDFFRRAEGSPFDK